MRTLLAVFALSFAASVCRGETDSFQAGSSLSVGPDGVSLKGPGLPQGINVKNDGNGVISSSFSISGAVNGASGQPTRTLPPIVVPPSSGVMTDTGAFFKSVGGGARELSQPRSRRPAAP